MGGGGRGRLYREILRSGFEVCWIMKCEFLDAAIWAIFE